jgi:hypothetical protein
VDLVAAAELMVGYELPPVHAASINPERPVVAAR